MFRLRNVGWLAALCAVLVIIPAKADVHGRDCVEVEDDQGNTVKIEYENEGEAPTTEQNTALCEAIDTISETAEESGDDEAKECAECLEQMKEAGRLCIEGNETANENVWGTTETDDMEGCESDGMNINPEALDCPDFLVALLCHEWSHVNEGPGGDATQEEIDALKEEKAWYEAIEATDNPEYAEACCQIEELEGTKKEDPPCEPPKRPLEQGLGGVAQDAEAVALPCNTPVCGFDEAHLQSSNYVVYQSEGFIHAYRIDQEEPAQHFQLDMEIGFSVIALPAVAGPIGGRVLAVSGRNRVLEGVVQYLEVDPERGRVVQSLRTVILGAEMDPVSMASDIEDGIDRLYVLDTHNLQILFVSDTDGDGMPEDVQAEPFATWARAPILRRAVSLEANGPQGTPYSVLAATEDRRFDHTVDFQEDMALISDLDGDGRAESYAELKRNDVLGVVPWPLVKPVFGDTRIDALASKGAPVELWEADAEGNLLRLIDASVGDDQNVASFQLAEPLVSGAHLAIRDLELFIDEPTHPFRVSATKAYREGCGGLTASLEGTGAVGDSLAWHLGRAAGGVAAALLLGSEPHDVDLERLAAPGCSLLTSAEYAINLVTTPQGTASFSAAVPDDPALIGLTLYGQWRVAEGGASDAVYSNGCAVQLMAP